MRDSVTSSPRVVNLKECSACSAGADAFVGLLALGLPGVFTTAVVAAGLAIPKLLAEKMAYYLWEMGVLSVAGKQGWFWLFARFWL